MANIYSYIHEVRIIGKWDKRYILSLIQIQSRVMETGMNSSTWHYIIHLPYSGKRFFGVLTNVE